MTSRFSWVDSQVEYADVGLVPTPYCAGIATGGFMADVVDWNLLQMLQTMHALGVTV